jgi:uncharacterized membrane protein
LFNRPVREQPDRTQLQADAVARRNERRSSPEPDEARPRSQWTWRRVLTPLVALAGLGVSTYLTLAHYSAAVTIACPETGVVNCEKVTTSAQSMVFGIPVAVLGLAFFVAMFVLCLPFAWRSPRRIVPWARLASSVVGVGFISYLVYAELYEIHAICLWCTSVHVLTFILFVAIVTGWEEATEPWYEEEVLVP